MNNTHEYTAEQLIEVTYRGFVGGKVKNGQHILDSLTPEKCHLLHMAIGVAGEAHELFEYTDRDNLIEECGDLEFFMEGMRINNIDLGYNVYSWHVVRPKFYDYTDTGTILRAIVVYASDILELTKKHVIYNKPLDTEFIHTYLLWIRWSLDAVYKKYDLTRVEVLEANKAKLDKRYVSGYSDKAAQERADKL